jgi:hypothetical protein
MKTRSKRLIAPILLIAAAICFMAPVSVFAQDAEWTLMFYMDSDNDLEGAQMLDLEEMMAAGGTQAVNIVVLADRSVKGERDDEDESKYTNRPIGGIPNWTTAKLLVVEKGRLRQLDDWGEVNMGDPANLKRFLMTVTRDFPAKRFGLIFGDHGAGWQGIVGDESHNGDSLTTLELPGALKDGTAQSGKLELIGFDACLMANLEAAKAVAPFGKTMVASEELEPGNGWHYTPLFNSLNQRPAMDGFALGRVIVDTYRNFYLGQNQGEQDATVTLSVIDLSKIPALETAAGELGTSNRAFLKGGRPSFIKTAGARHATEAYNADEDFVDLVDYATNIKRSDPQAAKAADAAIAATRAAVVYKINGPARPRSSGISIYFPPEREMLAGSGYASIAFATSANWYPFLGDFMGIKVADTQPPKIEKLAASDTQVAESDVPTVTASVSADDLAEATFVLAESGEDSDVIIGAIPVEPDEKGVLHEEWDGTWFTIGNDATEVICPITDFQELDDAQDVYLVEVPGQVRFRGGKSWRDITLYFVIDLNESGGTGEFVNAYEFRGGQAREVMLRPGDSIRPVYLSVDANGDTDEVASSDPEDIILLKAADGIAVGSADVASGAYKIGFVIADHSGNTDAEFVDVTVE